MEAGSQVSEAAPDVILLYLHSGETPFRSGAVCISEPNTGWVYVASKKTHPKNNPKEQTKV